MRYQWGEYYDRATTRQIERIVQLQGRSLLGASSFPDKILKKGRLRVAIWLTRLGLGNYGYAIKQAAIYGKYWEICQAAASHESASARNFS